MSSAAEEDEVGEFVMADAKCAALERYNCKYMMFTIVVFAKNAAAIRKGGGMRQATRSWAGEQEVAGSLVRVGWARSYSPQNAKLSAASGLGFGGVHKAESQKAGGTLS